MAEEPSTLQPYYSHSFLCLHVNGSLRFSSWTDGFSFVFFAFLSNFSSLWPDRSPGVPIPHTPYSHTSSPSTHTYQHRYGVNGCKSTFTGSDRSNQVRTIYEAARSERSRDQSRPVNSRSNATLQDSLILLVCIPFILLFLSPFLLLLLPSVSLYPISLVRRSFELVSTMKNRNVSYVKR